MQGLCRALGLIVLCSALSSALSGCGGGGGGTEAAPIATPSAVVRASAQAVSSSDPTTLQTTIGATVTFDGSGSSSAGGAITTYAWTLDAKPAGSSAAIVGTAAAQASFSPDIAGSYVISLQVTDAGGNASRQETRLTVTNTIPANSVVNSITFTGPSTTLPAQTVAVGTIFALDATSSSDPSAGAVGIAWTMLERPAGSSATIVVADASRAHFTPDALGRYRVLVRATNAAGFYSDVIAVVDANSNPPTTMVSAGVAAAGATGTLRAALGNQVVLDAGSSFAPAGHAVSSVWTMVSRPPGSTATLSASGGTTSGFTADVLGTYLVQFAMADSTSGLSSTFTTTVDVIQGPVPLIIGGSSPVASASAPIFVSQTGAPVTLHGGGSYDPLGGSLSFQWSLTGKPALSGLWIGTPTGADLTLTPDVGGAYTVQLAVTSSGGATSYQSVTFTVQNQQPLAIVDRTGVTALAGQTVGVSAAASYSPSGNPLTFLWSLDARPAGSSASIASTNASALSFTPDVAGSYTASLMVSDGPFSSVAVVTVVALSPTADTMPLTYKPVISRFSRALGVAVIVSAAPNALHLVNPAALTDDSVALPATAKSVSVSPDGALAAVLHEGTVSLVDLSTATLLRSSATYGSQTDLFVDNLGRITMFGQTGGQWLYNGAVVVIDGRTGATLQTLGNYPWYGTVYGVYSDVGQKLFWLSTGLSPAQIYASPIDPATGSVGAATGTPYWGDFAMSAPLWLSDDQSRLFTASGTYFKTSDLTYVGYLGTSLFSLSHSSSADELVAFANPSGGYWYTLTPSQYPQAYKRYTGSLLFPAADATLPIIGGKQSFGIAIFHRTNGAHAMVVQTGSDQASATGLQYFVIAR